MSIHKAAPFAVLFLLTSCATPSANVIPPSLCTTVERAPAVPDGAGIVQPVTEEEKAATRLFLGWISEVLGIETANANRAETAKGLC